MFRSTFKFFTKRAKLPNTEIMKKVKIKQSLTRPSNPPKKCQLCFKAKVDCSKIDMNEYDDAYIRPFLV